MTKKTFFEYLGTFSLAVVAAFLFVLLLLGLIHHQVYQDQDRQRVQDATVDDSLINVLIDKNKQMEYQYPDDYKINLKLGTLYEAKKNYKDAEIEYKTAISKAPFDQYRPVYRLASLYIFLNRLDEAQNLIDKIDERPDKRLIKYKGDIYSSLGDKYYSQGDYDNASQRYEKALFYYKIINCPRIDLIKGNLASSYIYLAEIKLDQMQVDDAIEYLQSAKAIFDAPIIKYKLALLLMDRDPDTAYQYLDEVFETAPEIINYDTYNKFLSELAEDANYEGDFTQAQLYEFKIKKLKDYFKTNIISVEDLKIVGQEGRITLNRWVNKYNIYFDLSFKNISKYSMSSLFLNVVFKDGNNIIQTYTQQVADDKSKLNAGAQSPIVGMKFSISRSLQDPQPKKITAEVYVSKSEHSYKLFLGTFDINQNANSSMQNKYIKKWKEFITKITSMLPAFLF